MISIIITAYKEPKTIGKAIRAVLDNKLKNYELIIASPDKATLDAASKFKQVKIIQDPGKGKPIALNLAIAKAKGDILVLTDGDVFINKKSLKPLLAYFSDPKIGAVTGRPISLNDKHTRYGFWSHFLADVANERRIKASKLGRRFFCSGYLYALRKNLLKPIPEDCVVEDGFFSHLIWQQGYKIAYSSESRVYVRYPTNLNDWKKQKIRSVGGYMNLNKRLGVEMRSFSQESSGLFDLFRYSKTLKQDFWALELIMFRIHLWLAIALKFRVKKEKSSQKIWTRIESTK